MSNAKQKLNALVNNKLKQSRFKIINADAFKLIVSHVSNASNVEQATQQMIDYLHQDSKNVDVLSLPLVQAVLDQYLSGEAVKSEVLLDMIRVIPADKMPHLKFDELKKTFYLYVLHVAPNKNRDTTTPTHFGTAQDKSALFRERLTILRQLILTNPDFQNVQLTPVEALNGSTGLKHVLGLLTRRDSTSSVYLEDHTSYVKLVLKDASCSIGYFTEGSMVLLKGEYDTDNSLFNVSVISIPETQERDKFLSSSGQHKHALDQFFYFGSVLESNVSLGKQQKHIQFLKDKEQEERIVFLSDVWLDKVQVHNHLRKVLESLESDPPAIIVFMGSFVSKPCRDRAMYKKYWDQFASIITEFPYLLRFKEDATDEPVCRFVFVPGPNDITASGDCLPQMPILPLFTKTFLENVGPKHCTFTTNPARLRIYSKEIVLFREDLQSKMQHHIAHAPLSTFAAYDHLSATVVHNAHLLPLPLSVKPVFWQFDHVLRLHPLPHMIVLGDLAEPYESEKTGCKVLNPSPFAVDASFCVYNTQSGETDWKRMT